VDCYLPYFRQWLITLPLSALLPFQSLFTIESSNRDQLLDSSLFSGMLSEFPPPLLCASFQFIVYYSFVCVCVCVWCGVGSVCPGGYAGLSQR
jgi:hypothetical protein